MFMKHEHASGCTHICTMHIVCVFNSDLHTAGFGYEKFFFKYGL